VKWKRTKGYGISYASGAGNETTCLPCRLRRPDHFVVPRTPRSIRNGHHRWEREIARTPIWRRRVEKWLQLRAMTPITDRDNQETNHENQDPGTDEDYTSEEHSGKEYSSKESCLENLKDPSTKDYTYVYTKKPSKPKTSTLYTNDSPSDKKKAKSQSSKIPSTKAKATPKELKIA
jgi:hypothetical protein